MYECFIGKVLVSTVEARSSLEAKGVYVRICVCLRAGTPLELINELVDSRYISGQVTATLLQVHRCSTQLLIYETVSNPSANMREKDTIGKEMSCCSIFEVERGTPKLAHVTVDSVILCYTINVSKCVVLEYERVLLWHGCVCLGYQCF